ncbi:Protein-tyrosine phosphatase, low molecular weight [Thioalkalivibrio sulfidiphilus HL-EbGr7]|uniref:Protein-tyrosine phosphatase, low molecular weight n=1 Tax=Thioalkalivibrio sulfidiphilus (strain HL-EbGR7) TaxID=396588 RepID=B8GPA1_THISH|nr:protein-tyrosine-phosphatase [Thioalkalivibrio sulfidiphilus]ACL74021.1 Protein-tyrosine phosphatase, low molecular weight [Thioalkalivibrio sulfidiphilus HL-EbGr7]
MATGKANLRRKPHILFVSQATSARTPMAAAYGAQMLGDLVEVRAAGMEVTAIDPRTRDALKQEGLKAEGLDSRRLDEDLLEWADLVVTLCADAQRIRLPERDSFVHKNWPIDSPARQATGSEDSKPYLRTRDEIKRRVHQLATSIKLMHR